MRLLATCLLVLLAAYLVFGDAVRTPESSTSAVELDTPREVKIIRPTGDLKSIRVVSWNIDRGRQLDRLSSELAREVPDLCLLQEVDWNTRRTGNRDIGSELARRLDLNLAYAVEFEELSQEDGRPAFIGQATLTRLPIRTSRVLRFRTQSGFWKPRSWLPSSLPLMQRRLGSRVGLVTELELAGQLLVVYNVHLESRSMGTIQMAQLDEVLSDLKKYPANTAAILGGDLNTKYFPSLFLRKLEHAGFRSVTGQRIERTHAIAMTLDWIFARRPVRIEAGGIRRDFKGSDHYPVYARIVLGE